MKMLVGYARFLPPSDARLRALRLTQPKGAAAAWAQSVVNPGGEPCAVDSPSERMVLYCTTRSSYPPSAELSVDYGIGYTRTYHSGKHRGRAPKWRVPIADGPSEGDLRAARWPHLPGWFNPHAQPPRRPAFALTPRGPRVCADASDAVAARREALGTPPRLRAEAAARGGSAACSPRSAVAKGEKWAAGAAAAALLGTFRASKKRRAIALAA